MRGHHQVPIESFSISCSTISSFLRDVPDIPSQLNCFPRSTEPSALVKRLTVNVPWLNSIRLFSHSNCQGDPPPYAENRTICDTHRGLVNPLCGRFHLLKDYLTSQHVTKILMRKEPSSDIHSNSCPCRPPHPYYHIRQAKMQDNQTVPQGEPRFNVGKGPKNGVEQYCATLH